jgi:hypothetical protein
VAEVAQSINVSDRLADSFSPKNVAFSDRDVVEDGFGFDLLVPDNANFLDHLA